MKEPRLEEITIVEPPLQELHKKNSWFAKSCVSGCGCVVFFILAVIIGIKLYLGPSPRESLGMPTNFPASIPLYDQENIEKVTVIPGRYARRSIELSALVPHLLLSPLITRTDSAAETGLSTTSFKNLLGSMWTEFRSPEKNITTTIRIVWRDLAAKPDFVLSFYEQNLKKQNYAISKISKNDRVRSFNFQGPATKISGTLSVTDGDAKKKETGTPYALLIIRVPFEVAVIDTPSSTPVFTPHAQTTTFRSL